MFLSDGPWTDPAAAAAAAATLQTWTAPLPILRADEPSPAPRPSVTSTAPGDGAAGVLRDTFVSANLSVIGGAGIDTLTLSAHTVRLYRTSDGAVVAASLNTSAGGDVLVLTPSQPLDPDTQYTFEVTDGLRDLSGYSFVPFVTHFTTGTASSVMDPTLKFNKVVLANVPAAHYTAVTTGPDGRLYAGTESGEIIRFDIATDGTLANPAVIRSLIHANGGAPRALTGIEFDPASTASDLALWVTHSHYAIDNGPDWTGKVTRLSGPDLQTVQDYVVGLPRSTRDHLTNQLHFGPDRAIYFPQASNTAMGAPDHAWHFRTEHALTAAILRLDVSLAHERLVAGHGPLDVRTEEGGTYDPLAAGAPLTVYATGVRNAYDLLWHSNGHLFATGNGSQRGGATPAGGAAPAIPFVEQVENDYLFRIDAGAYYGHPNPTRGEYVRNGGNPTELPDPYELVQYPVGTPTEPHYRLPVFDFGQHFSPNGIIEYRGGAFGGSLHGKMLIARYSGGDDVVILGAAPDGRIIEARDGIQGLRNFNDPLDLTEDLRTGYLYVAEFGGQTITLVKPDVEGAPPGVSPPAPAVPLAPQGLSVKLLGRNQFELNWTDTVGESGYVIERSADGAAGQWTTVGTTAPNETRFLDGNLERGATYAYRIRAASSAGDSGASAAAGATTLPRRLPDGWSGFDVGPVAIAGTGELFEGAFELSGSGAGVGGEADAFYFAGLPVGGDVEIVARVTGVSLASGAAKAGVMIRSDAGPSAAGAMLEITPALGAQFQSRADTGAGTSHAAPIVHDVAPTWIRLVRRGDTVSGYTSADGLRWARVSFTRIALGERPLVGLAVTSQDNSTLCSATFDNVSITEAAPLVVPPAPADVLALVDGTRATISWRDMSLDETTFAIDRRRAGAGAGAGGAWLQVGTADAESETYADEHLAPSRKYEYRVRAANAAGTSDASAVASVKTGRMTLRGQEAFGGGTPVHVPALIEAEAFDDGPRGRAWRDRTPDNDTGAFRDTGVDLAATSDPAGGAYHVAAASRGEWLEYTIDVPVGGIYTLDIRYAAAGGYGGAAKLESAGKNLVVGASSISLPASGGWDTWQTASGVISLKAGVQVLRFSPDSASGTVARNAPVEIANINWLRIERADPATVASAQAVSAPLRKSAQHARFRTARLAASILN